MIVAQYPLNLSQYGPYLEISFGSTPDIANSKKSKKEVSEETNKGAENQKKANDLKTQNEIKTFQSSHVFGLYIPEDFSSNISIEWNAADILGLGDTYDKIRSAMNGGNVKIEDITKSALTAGTQAFKQDIYERMTSGHSALAKAWSEAEYKLGVAFNPMQRLKFESVDFFQMDLAWDMIPQSEEEAKNVELIIKSFQELSLPSFDKNESWLSKPSTAKIRFVEGGDVDGVPIAAISDFTKTEGDKNMVASNLIRFASTMALISVNVKLLNENSSMFYANGRAIGYNMSCTFRSIYKTISNHSNNNNILKISDSEYNG